jgi:hypothetical protein
VSGRSRRAPGNAAVVRAERRQRRALRRSGRIRSYFASIRLDDALVFALVTVLSVWGWISFTLGPGLATGGGAVAAGGSLALGTLLLAAVRYHRYKRFPDDTLAQEIRVPLLFAPVITSPLILLAITPPGTAVEGFDPAINVYGLIALSALLMVGGVLAGILLFGIIVWPVLALIDAVVPPKTGTGLSLFARVLSRGELAAIGVMVLAMVAFGCALVAVYPEATGSRVQKLTQTLIAWITFRGEPLPSVLALLFALTIVAAVWFHLRLQGRAVRG